MKFQAAILFKKNKIKILKLTLPSIRKGQVLVKIKYSSICHTQLQEIMGLRGKDNFLPHCLGHEATGIVERIGEGVKKVKKGDKVCLTWIKSKGLSAGGVKYLYKNKKIINAGPVNTFSKYAIISEDRTIKLPKKSNLKKNVLMGCAVPTAFNAIFNSLKNTNKENIIIFGAGGIGLACIFAAKKAGFKKIFALDKIEKKLKLAKKFGATDILKLRGKNLIHQLKKFNNFFYNGIECTGNLDLMKNAIPSIKNFGGQFIIIGNYSFNSKVQINPWNFIMGKIVKGAWIDELKYDIKFPKFYKYFKNFKWQEYLSNKIYNLEEINIAIKDFKEGKVIRPLIKM